MRATCQVNGCPWVVYASRDHEDTCWQIKTFVRKYPNFKHCDAATYFKSRFDLSLNKNAISRAFFDARNVVFGDEKEQYKMLRDYGDTGYEKYEVHGYPANHVVDLGKHLCLCQFWMLAESLKPQPPKIKRGPGKLQHKRRMDTNEAKGGSKKSKPTSTKDNINLKRQLAPFTCNYCGEKGHTKRGCKKKKLADAAAKAKAAAAAQAKLLLKIQVELKLMLLKMVRMLLNLTPMLNLIQMLLMMPMLVKMLQLTLQTLMSNQLRGVSAVCTITKSRSDKLPPKRKSSISPTSAHAPVNPMQGASSGTVARLGSILKFIPTPGFKAPRKKN
ncbi:hypothetical protein Ahy_A09g043669 [Arachis hypogaea]|uniref:CCHC-type domain-containing protein n=1 Tax=Arachis hypogaea TaxID=3818 RepID=A0A445BIV6_ARAHY|nr:hypothetical protein Ahy_A09g043669 [Arachis hypogaea]